jgi:alpha-tubulin suppressor-like RCC1 family protein
MRLLVAMGLACLALLGCGARTQLPDGSQIVDLGQLAASVDAGYGKSCVVDVAAGDWDACAIRSDGTLWCWGMDLTDAAASNAYGREHGSSVPLQVTGINRPVVKVAIGSSSICAITDDGALWCWGAEGFVTMDPNEQPQYVTPNPTRVTGLAGRVADVACGAAYACALLEDASVWCWGDPHYPAPVVPTSLHQNPAVGSRTSKLSARWNNVCSIYDDHSLWCWGLNNYGALGIGSDNGYGGETPSQVLSLGNHVADVSVGYDEICSALDNGTLWCSGRTRILGLTSNSWERPLPMQIPDLENNVRSVAVGGALTCALGATGWVSCWGQPWTVYPGLLWGYDQPTRLANGAEQIVAGQTFVCLRHGGLVWCFGDNHAGQLGIGTKTRWEKLTDQSLPVALPCP